MIYAGDVCDEEENKMNDILLDERSVRSVRNEATDKTLIHIRQL